MNKITVQHIVRILKRTDEIGTKAVTMAMIRLYERQTRDEQNVRATRYQNGVGFSAADAKRGSYYAQWAIYFGQRPGEYRYLTGIHLAKARVLALKYRKQLRDIAQERAVARARKAAKQRAARTLAATSSQARINGNGARLMLDMLSKAQEADRVA